MQKTSTKKSPIKKRRKARILVLHCLYQLEQFENISADDVFETTKENFRIPDVVVDFGKELLNITINNHENIQKVLEEHVKNWDVKRLSIIDRAILKMGIAELLYMPDIPVSVTINEAVTIANSYSIEKAGNFVNGVLDKIAKTLVPEKEI